MPLNIPQDIREEHRAVLYEYKLNKAPSNGRFILPLAQDSTALWRNKEPRGRADKTQLQ
jgi:hypothetical protein